MGGNTAAATWGSERVFQISKYPKWINGYLAKASVYFEISNSPNLQNGEMEIWRNGEIGGLF